MAMTQGSTHEDDFSGDLAGWKLDKAKGETEADNLGQALFLMSLVADKHGIRSLVQEVVASELFQTK